MSLVASFDVIFQRYRKETESLQGDNKKYVAQLYKERFESIRAQFEKKALVTLPKAQAYLDQVAKEIIRNNPLLQSSGINVFFSKTAIPNAACWGEGTIIFNIGLFTKLQNESQVAFVLCHELAHSYLDHNNNSIHKYVNTLYSKETQEELKRIKNAEYNRRKQLEALIKGMAFDYRRHSRDHETEADSVGMEFMKNTSFDVREALSCLSLLDSVDKEHFNAGAFLQQQFNSREYPFQKKWIRKEQGLLGGHAAPEAEDELEDSLKTHPDCKTRVLILQNAVNRYANAGRKKDPVNADRFHELQAVFPYETVSWYNDSKQYSLCLYHALQLLEKKPGDAYAIVMIGETLNNIYYAQKNHALGKVTDVPGPSYPASYNLLLQFIQNLYLEEIALINYHFLKQYEPQLSGYNNYADVWRTARQMAGK